MTGSPTTGPRVALLHWGDVIEDFLDDLDVTVDGFCEQMTGGWMFGYVDALQRAGVDTVLIVLSATVTAPTRRHHLPTGAVVWVLPPTATHRFLRKLLPHRYAWSLREALTGTRGIGRLAAGVSRQLVGYCSTPVRAVARVLRAEGCTAVLHQEYEHPRFDVGVLMGVVLGVPVFATFQGGDRAQTAVERPLRRAALRMAAGLLIGSRSEAARVQRRYGVAPAKVTHVANPLDVSWWRAADRTASRGALGIGPDELVVVWHGRVDAHRKGLDVLLAAWRALKADGHDHVRLLLVGTGVDREWLGTELASEPDVRWVDEYVTDRQAVRRFLSAADVYAFPSRHEGFPVAPIEALACGLPVVAAAAPGVAEIFADGESSGGVVVPVGDVDAFTAGLVRIIGDPALRAELGLAARRRAVEAFSPEAVGAHLRGALQV